MVISGNGRSMGLRQAYKQGTANGYREWITQHANDFGVDPDYISKMKSPVLVREITSDVKDMARFAAEANESSVSSMASSEKAMSNADLISEEDLVEFNFDKDFKAKSNRKFIMQVISKMPASEQASLLQSNGKPSPLGIERVFQALIAKAYNNENILTELTDTDDTTIPSVANGLEAAAPQMAKFENSNIRPELSLANDISQAVSTLKTLRESNQSVEEYTSSTDLFGAAETNETMTDEAKKLLEFFGTKKQNGRYRTAKQISQGLIKYAEEAMTEARNGQNILTDDVLRSKGQILDKVLNEIYEKEAQGVEEFEESAIERKSEKRTLDSKGTTVKTESTTQGTTTEKLRQDVEKRLMNVGVSREEARINSELFIKWEDNFAKINGISLEQSLAAENLRFEFHDEIVEKDKAGHVIGKPRAQMVIRNGEAILKITKMSDQSSILHEFGHLFLQRIYNLARNNNLKEGTLKQNWDALLEAYNVTEQQLAKNTALFEEVQERFATDFERYMREGKSPSKGLKHVFETFKKWLRGIYASVRDIEYIGADRRRHSPRLSKEARQFFNYMLGDDVQQETSRQALLNNGNGEEKTFNNAMSERATEINAQEQLDAVRKQYEGTDKWLKAPNGKKSNLSEKQWLQVRTPNFKRWFGEWNYDDNKKIKVSEIDSEKLPFDWKDTKNIKQWLKNNLAGQEVSIDSSGAIVGFTSRGLGDSLKNRGLEQRSTYVALSDVIKNAVFFDYRAVDDQKKHEHLKGQDLYYSAIKINDAVYPVKITLDVHKNTPLTTYKGHKTITGITITPAVYMAETKNGVPSQSGIEVSIQDLTNGVKPENCSKVVDENGEPLVVWHGGENNEFSKFDKTKVSPRKDLREGFYFVTTSRRAVATFYGQGEERAFFLNIKNPLMINPDTKITTREGHDGIISVANEDFSDVKNGDIIEIIAFEPEQIKSATDNRGTFDGNDAEIYNQIIGDKGAKELDRKHGNTKITDNLAIAKQMTEAGKRH